MQKCIKLLIYKGFQKVCKNETKIHIFQNLLYKDLHISDSVHKDKDHIIFHF